MDCHLPSTRDDTVGCCRRVNSQQELLSIYRDSVLLVIQCNSMGGASKSSYYTLGSKIILLLQSLILVSTSSVAGSVLSALHALLHVTLTKILSFIILQAYDLQLE